MSRRLPLRGLLEALGFFLLAFAVRALPYPSLMLGRGDTVFFGNDAYYHARRVWYSVVHFPTVLERDPYMNFPHGGEPIWAPTIDWLAAGLVRLLVGADDPAAMEQILIWTPPVLGALTVVGVYGLVARHFSRGSARVAAAILACLPAHIWYSQLGFFDHHVASALATLVLLAAAMELFALPEAARGRTPWLRSGVAGLALAGVLLVWPGSLLHIFIVEVAFAVRLLTAGSREEAVAWGRRFGGANVLACGVVWPLSAGNTWDYWGDFSPLVLSRFQPVFFAAAAICFAAVSEFWHRTSRPVAAWARWLQAIVFGVVTLGVCFAIFPGLEAGIEAGWDWFAKAESFQAEVAESKALFSEGFKRPEELLTRFLYLVPLLLLAFAESASRRLRPAPDFLFLGWATVLALATIVQLRFANSFSIAFSILIATTCVPLVTEFFRERALNAPLRAVVVVVGLAFVLYALAPAVRTQQKHIENLAASVSGEKIRPIYLTRLQVVREEMARWLRRHTEPTRGWLAAGQGPEYAILAPWSVGHVLKYVARRPVLQDNFGDDAAPENMKLAQRYFESEDESKALALLDGIPVRYVIVRDPVQDRLHSGRAFRMENRLFRFRGSGKWVVGEGGTTEPKQVSALERHRLVYESVPLYGASGRQEALYRVFEIVAGAKIVGRARPGEVVTARLPLASRNQFGLEYQVRTRADENGRWTMRVPYSNDGHTPGIEVGEFYAIESEHESTQLRVSEAQIRAGATLRAPPLGNGS